MTIVKTRKQKRLEAAEEVCWTVLMMMEFNLIQADGWPDRSILAQPMQDWGQLAHQTELFRNNTGENDPPFLSEQNRRNLEYLIERYRQFVEQDAPNQD